MSGPDLVNSLLQKLRENGQAKPLETQDLQRTLEQLKVLGRRPDQSAPLFEKQAIDVVAYYGFDNGASNAAREALRCLANALLLVSATRQMLVDLGYAPKAAARLRTGNLDDEFLCSRILMLLTYETDLDFVNLVKQNDVDTTIVERLEQHGSSTGDTSSSAPTTTTSAMALAEMLSLTYNLIHLYTPLAEQFVPALTPSLNILRTYSFKTQQPIDPPVRQLINVLLILAPACSKDDTSKALVSRSGVELLLKLLDAGLKHYALPELDTNIAPLVSLLAQIYTASASDIRDLLESRLLPTAQERDKPLGKSDTLFSRLIKLTTSPSTPHLKELIPQLMWELSHADPNTLVRNVGYGYASGFLVNKGFTSSDVDPQAGTFARGRNSNGHVNFVTGQYRENEPQDSGPSMTDEEKEQEAERLFVLFERLKQTGVVNVENPVETAAREGRLEELDE